MELFIWAWLYDRRFLCGLRHGYFSTVYSWLLPILVSVSMLAFTWFHQVQDARDMGACLQSDSTREKANSIERLIMIQQGLLAAIIVLSVWVMVRAENGYKKYFLQEKAQMHVFSNWHPRNTFGRNLTCYDYWVRHEAIKGVPGLALLVLAIANFIFSFAFLWKFRAYGSALDSHANLENISCEVAGSLTLALYSLCLVLVPGLLIVTIFMGSLVYKLFFVFTLLICPIKFKNCRKIFHGRGHDYSDYETEFSFKVDPQWKPPAEADFMSYTPTQVVPLHFNKVAPLPSAHGQGGLLGDRATSEPGTRLNNA